MKPNLYPMGGNVNAQFSIDSDPEGISLSKLRAARMAIAHMRQCDRRAAMLASEAADASKMATSLFDNGPGRAGEIASWSHMAGKAMRRARQWQDMAESERALIRLLVGA